MFRYSILRSTGPLAQTLLKQRAVTTRSIANGMLFKSSASTVPSGFSQSALRFYAASKLNKDDVLKRVRDVVKTFNKTNEASDITAETAFNKDLGLDSLDTVELLVAVEEEFEIEIPDKIADELKTVGETVDYIVSNPEST